MPLELNGTTGVQGNSGALVSGTAVASTSGTSIDFTGIPSWVKRITVILNGVSTNSSNPYLVQIGSGSVTTTGYVSAAGFTGSSVGGTTSTAGFIIVMAASAPGTISGHCQLTLISTNTWVCSSVMARNDGFALMSGGNIALSGSLDRVRITTTSGTDVFDAGSINILYE